MQLAVWSFQGKLNIIFYREPFKINELHKRKSEGVKRSNTGRKPQRREH
jgi:hypothetical protein